MKRLVVALFVSCFLAGLLGCAEDVDNTPVKPGGKKKPAAGETASPTTPR